MLSTVRRFVTTVLSGSGRPALLTRMALVLIALLGTDIGPPGEEPLSGLELTLYGLLFLVCTVLLLLLVMAFARVGNRRQKWSRPSWRIQPFFGEPLQFFHAMAFFVAAGGIRGVLDATLFGGDWSIVVMLVGSALGLFLGIALVLRLMPSAFSHTPTVAA